MASLSALLFPIPGAAFATPVVEYRGADGSPRRTGILLGGHVFGAGAGPLMPLLWVAIASGAVMMAIELYPTAHWAHQVCALFVYAKLGVLCLVPFLWAQRVPLLLAVLVLASVGAHAPRRVRHYSVWFRRVMVD